MRADKKKRLTAEGWRLGTAAEFLGLSPDEEAFIELRLKLAEGLRQRRKSRGVTQVALARALKSSQSRVAKMEAGDPTVSLDLLVRSLLALGTSNRELAAIIARR
ncbi:MAG: helix-turn-helix domain-containing protein [Chromatiales bacterium]|jgi:DNA-binding XRE family transcriptional regulator|nr:helix-turn-helix domain-containing protein [Chromatiales bacterium]